MLIHKTWEYPKDNLLSACLFHLSWYNQHKIKLVQSMSTCMRYVLYDNVNVVGYKQYCKLVYWCDFTYKCICFMTVNNRFRLKQAVHSATFFSTNGYSWLSGWTLLLCMQSIRAAWVACHFNWYVNIKLALYCPEHFAWDEIKLSISHMAYYVYLTHMM